ncbi:DUF6056 family protein [Paenibacillus elgii]
MLFVFLVIHLLHFKKILQEQKTRREFILAIVFVLSGMISFCAMILSPEFPSRATFGGSVFFIISIIIFLKTGLINKKNKNLKIIIAIPILTYMIFSMAHVFQKYNTLNYEATQRNGKIEKQLAKGNFDLKLDSFTVNNDRYTFIYDITLNPNYTTNVHFAKYYGLKTVQINSPFISIEFDNPDRDSYQIYYDSGKGFNKIESTKSYIYNKVDGNILYFSIPDGNINNLRVYPGTKARTVRIKNITISMSSGKKSMYADEILKYIKSTSNIETLRISNGIIEMEKNAIDSYFDLKLL